MLNKLFLSSIDKSCTEFSFTFPLKDNSTAHSWCFVGVIYIEVAKQGSPFVVVYRDIYVPWTCSNIDYVPLN